MQEFAGTILICLLLSAGVTAAVVSLVKRKKRGCGCGCQDCTGCKKNSSDCEEKGA